MLKIWFRSFQGFLRNGHINSKVRGTFIQAGVFIRQNMVLCVRFARFDHKAGFIMLSIWCRKKKLNLMMAWFLLKLAYLTVSFKLQPIYYVHRVTWDKDWLRWTPGLSLAKMQHYRRDIGSFCLMQPCTCIHSCNTCSFMLISGKFEMRNQFSCIKITFDSFIMTQLLASMLLIEQSRMTSYCKFTRKM